MIHNKILYATIVFLISFSCVGFAAENTSHYNDSVRVNDLMGEDVSSRWWNYSNVDWIKGTNDAMKLRDIVNHVDENISTTSQSKELLEFDCAVSKKKYVDQLLQLEEFKNYSRDELGKNFLSYSEISSVLIDDALERKHETYETVSIDKNTIKIEFSSEYDSLYFENSDNQRSMVSTRALVPNVVVTGASCDWRWVQNTIVGNQITLHNYGTTTANGVVVLRSEDEMLGWATSYSNLAPGGDIVISLPFYVNPTDFPTVGAKPIRILAYVQVDSLYYLTSAPTISTPMIEMYNNNAGYLVDPDGGRSLEMDDLNHQNLYDVARRAAIAGDDTSIPYQTAAAILATVNSNMTYNENALSPLYTGADIWVINDNFNGICDEFAVLYGSYSRALGIPTRRIAMLFTIGEISSGHQINEFWDGSGWIHVDATGNSISNPRVYTDGLGWNIYDIGAAYGADDSRSALDGPNNDNILHGLLDMQFWVPNGLVNRYC
ncbi:MAG: hypothetical protein PWP14_531 [Methanolobus sp.]|nr:hypothetical protein [Methanolobus sp.]